MGNPEMIILDEPSEGLAPVIVDQLADTIQTLKDEGVSILLAEQNLNFAKFICDRAYIICQGSVCHESTIDALSTEEYEKYCSIWAPPLAWKSASLIKKNYAILG